VGDSFRLIQRGDADVMIAGGSEAAITPLGVGGFAAMRALSTRNDAPARASRPFDKDRDGFVIGEGAGILILEERERARARGARVYCEILGYGMSSDAYHISAPSETGDGAIRVMRNTLKDARVEPSAVGYVNVHGTSTPRGDVVETIAIKSVFGEHARKMAISSTKSMTGHLLGAAGGLEAGITALALRDQMLPPTINQETPDPECDLDCVPNRSRKVELRYALSNSFGFGGTNGALLFARHDA
jgi:3-oxoacyl-[acyl-carrier-protein] synthase II